MERIQPDRQKKYRDTQNNKGLVRYEIQITRESKQRFEALVESAAEEYAAPYDKRQRTAKARADIFDEVTRGVLHEFFELKDRVKALNIEIKALSPTFFGDDKTNTPLPQSINSLPDSPAQLKKILAKLYRESQQDKLIARENKRQAAQYLALYETMEKYNDELQKKLKENDLALPA